MTSSKLDIMGKLSLRNQKVIKAYVLFRSLIAGVIGYVIACAILGVLGYADPDEDIDQRLFGDLQLLLMAGLCALLCAVNYYFAKMKSLQSIDNVESSEEK